MSSTILNIEEVSKQYQLGQFGTGTLSHDLNRWFARVRGKEDPYLKLTEINDRTTGSSTNFVWALRNISFSVKEGEVLGVIGRNGAGKSTLLKILSRITSPTVGRVKINGRLGSLLEVGTGFHPELTGMENIFLNGAIMGMTKSEIKKRLDQIVDFSGCEKYLDTPVKRYSSGMIVRLGFSVAAHLEPEILIVDEVLAVGDIEFQKKCLGKMKDVSGSGRTVLFVSHNMGSVSELCSRTIMLKEGEMFMDGPTDKVIQTYRESFSSVAYEKLKDIGNEIVFSGINVKVIAEKVIIEVQINNRALLASVNAGFLIKDQWGQKIGTVVSDLVLDSLQELKWEIEVDCALLMNGSYYIDAALFIPGVVNYEYLDDVVVFELSRTLNHMNSFENKNVGSVRLNAEWHRK